MPKRLTLPRWIPAAAGAAVLVAAGGVAYGAASQPDTVACTTSPCTVTVTFPTPTTSTVTVTAPPTTVTQTVTASPTTDPTSSTTTTATTSPTTTTAPPAGCPVAGKNKPGASDGKGGCFPGPGNTGVPAGTALTAYTGSLTISADNTVIDGKTFAGRVKITGKNVTISRSRLPYGLTTTSTGATVSDSYIAAGDGQDKAADIAGVTLLRSEVDGKGGNSGGWCATTCTIRDSWLHVSARRYANDHNSGFRIRQNGALTHNTLACEVPPAGTDGGCSAALTGYGDFEAVINNTMTGNLFVASTQQAFCAYGGSSGPKPYTAGAHDNRFIDNVFQRGTNRECGAYAPIGDYDLTKPGNAMTGNTWDDGAAVTAADIN